MAPTDFSKLQKILQGLYAKDRTEEMLGIAFKLIELESGSGKILEFLLFHLPGDTVFAHRTAGRPVAPERAAVYFRLAEICRDKRAFAEMDKLLARCIRDGRDEFVYFLALCLTGDFTKAYALAPALIQNTPSPEMLMAAADPWENIYPLSRIRPALAGVEAALSRLKGPAKILAGLHRFILAQKAGLNPDLELPRSLSATRAILFLPAAKVFLDRLEFEKAEKILRAAEAAWPGSERTCGNLAEAMFCSGKQEAALDFMAGKQALIKSPGFRAWRGQLLLFHGRYEEAVAELGGPIASGNVLGWCWRGAALFKLGRYGPALRDLDTAIRINPADWEARVWRAELLRTRKKPERALADLVRTLKDLPEHPWALANFALLAAERGDLAAFTAAFGRLPENIKLACGRAGSKPAALAGLLERLKGVRRHEPRFFHAALQRRALEARVVPEFPRSAGRVTVKNAVEIEITTHCNLGCYNCDRSTKLAPSRELMSLDQLLFFMRESIRLKRDWDYISLLGGEPTLHPRLLSIVEAFRRLNFDTKKLQVVTNGYGREVRAVLKRLPAWVFVNNTKKTSPLQKFRLYNLAPVDFGVKDASPCCIPQNCGYGLTRYGYYPCGAGASIDRVFGFDVGIKRLEELTAANTERQLRVLCRYCGHSPSLDTHLASVKALLRKGVVRETFPAPSPSASRYIAPVSGSWLAAYEKYRKKKPVLRLYGEL